MRTFDDGVVFFIIRKVESGGDGGGFERLLVVVQRQLKMVEIKELKDSAHAARRRRSF